MSHSHLARALSRKTGAPEHHSAAYLNSIAHDPLVQDLHASVDSLYKRNADAGGADEDCDALMNQFMNAMGLEDPRAADERVQEQEYASEADVTAQINALVAELLAAEPRGRLRHMEIQPG